jgi:Cytochrome c3
MKPMLSFSALLCPVAALAWLAQPVFSAEEGCVNCHQKQQQLFAPSAHAEAGVRCHDCHGGDPKAKDKTAHAAKDFQRPDSKRAIAELCAHCHSDVRRMNPYGLPTDQLERYKTSKHGEQLFGHNDSKVAVCTDCHGVHDIFKARAPQSPTHPANVPRTCGRCHSDEKLMAEYKLPANVVAEYKTSYHAHLVLDKGDLSAPTCVTCHGNHGARPPGVAEVEQVCGKCHVRQRELYEKSPHAEVAAAGGFPGCIGCHGNHAIQKASPSLFAKACVQCHEKTDHKQLAVRDELAGILQKANADYNAAAAKVREATLRGLATDEEQLQLQEAHTQLTQLEALQHTLTPATVKPVADRAENAVQETLKGVAWLERVENWKRGALVPVWVFLLAMAGLCAAKRRQIKRRDDS